MCQKRELRTQAECPGFLATVARYCRLGLLEQLKGEDENYIKEGAADGEPQRFIYTPLKFLAVLINCAL